MCGIAGFAGWEADGAELARMCDALRHRGPADEGMRAVEGVGLGMRRLTRSPDSA